MNLTYGQYIQQKQHDGTDRSEMYDIQVNDPADELIIEEEAENNELGRERSNEIINTQLTNELKRLHRSFNPTNNDMVDYALIGSTDEEYEIPNSFGEAWDRHDNEQKLKWREAINKEIQDWTKRKILEFILMEKKPLERKLIGSRWVFIVKRNRVFRARLCALGYAQIPGVDHQDNFTPVVLDTTFRVALIYMLKTKRIGKIIDVVTAFLYGDLEANIYMKVPEGFKECLKKAFKNNCAIMRKVAYGLVQAARQYYKKFVRIITKEMWFEKCMADQSLLKREDESGVVLICIYVDDTLCIGDREALENSQIK